MDAKSEPANLAKTKIALAEKYDKLADEARSKPKKMQFMHKAERYRRQAALLLRTRGFNI